MAIRPLWIGMMGDIKELYGHIDFYSASIEVAVTDRGWFYRRLERLGNGKWSAWVKTPSRRKKGSVMWGSERMVSKSMTRLGHYA